MVRMTKMTIEELVREVKRGIFVKLKGPFGLSPEEYGRIWRVGFGYYKIEGEPDEIKRAIWKARREGKKSEMVVSNDRS